VRHLWLVLSTVVCLLGAAAPARAELDAWLLTMGVGDSLWERYGHTAVRVSDGTLDVAYSFGAAPFGQPSFIWSFLRGEAEFGVVVDTYPATMRRYEKWDRTVWEQKLHLPPERMLWLARALAAHVRPPLNRYRYDHLYNNCATQVRDLLDQASTGALRRAGLAHVVGGRSFRDDMLEGAAGHWLGHIGADLISGPYEDRPVPDGWVEMYLPLALRDRLAEARLDDGTPLAAPMHELRARKGPVPNAEPIHAAQQALATLALAIFALVLGACHARAPELLRLLAQVALRALIVMFSVFGLAVVPLVLVSSIPNLSPNYNAFLFVPFDLVFFGLTKGLMEARPRSRPLMRYLVLRAAVVGITAALAFTGLLGQEDQAFALAALAYMGSLGVVAWKRTAPG
jgi:hypothetical protein